MAAYSTVTFQALSYVLLPFILSASMLRFYVPHLFSLLFKLFSDISSALPASLVTYKNKNRKIIKMETTRIAANRLICLEACLNPSIYPIHTQKGLNNESRLKQRENVFQFHQNEFKNWEQE